MSVVMEVNENTTPASEIPESSSSPLATETESSEDKQLQEEMVQWKQRLTTLKNNENYEDKVTNAECYLHCESKNWATFIFTVTLANVDRFQ